MSTLNRRNFLGRVGGLLALSPFAASWTKAQEESGEAKKERFTYEDIQVVTRFTARSEESEAGPEGELRLEVELLVLEEGQIEERRTPNGPEEKRRTGQDEKITYFYQGKQLPVDCWGYRSFIKKFDFFWGKQQIEIPRRFWEDLCRFRIETVQIDSRKLSSRELFELNEFKGSLMRPRVFLSAEGCTALIEWERREDGCDSHSTTRWMISKSGTVLRHRHAPPHEC